MIFTLPERLDWLWFLGMKIDDPIPDHSVLSKARRRWGMEPFRLFFERIVLQCVESGLVDGSKVFIDASLIDANASLNSVVDTASLKSGLRRDYEELLSRLEARDLEDNPEDVSSPGGCSLVPEAEGDWTSDDSSVSGQAVSGEGEDSRVEESDSSSGRGKNPSGKVNSRFISSTDTEARIVRQGGGKPRLCHKIHRAVDELSEIITASRVIRGDANEAHGLFALVEDHRLNSGKSARTVIADARYGIKSNFPGCSSRRIRAHIPDPWAERTSKPYFPENLFAYDDRQDIYICPDGKELRRWTYIRKEQSLVYKADRNDCKACERQPLCTRRNGARTIKRLHRGEELKAMRLAARSEISRRDLKKRQQLMERSFATGTRYGIKRARWRGITKMEIQELVTASIQNIMKLISRAKTPNGNAIIKIIENSLEMTMSTPNKSIFAIL